MVCLFGVGIFWFSSKVLFVSVFILFVDVDWSNYLLVSVSFHHQISLLYFVFPLFSVLVEQQLLLLLIPFIVQL